jgi:hypothetical protein
MARCTEEELAVEEEQPWEEGMDGDELREEDLTDAPMQEEDIGGERAEE